MMNNRSDTLRSIFVEHKGKVSDKWSMYLDEYNRLFDAYRDLPVHLLEIGIQNGGSLEIWNKFFPNAVTIAGCDNNPVCAQLKYEDPKIAVVTADANTDEAEQLILGLSSHFDLIIDDGSHHSGDIVRSFARYLPHLSDGGLYIAEDLHCSYWQEFDGGIYHPDSSIAFFKRLADIINHEHWGIAVTRCEFMQEFHSKHNAELNEISLASIHSIEFTNSMCVIRKARPDSNVLGRRLIVGTDALVCSDILPFHGSSSLLTSQIDNPWSGGDTPVEAALLARTQEVADLTRILSVRDIEIAALDQTAAESGLEHLAQVAAVQQQLEVKLLELASREVEIAQQLLDIRQTHEAQLAEQKRQHSVLEQSFSAHLQAGQGSTNIVPPVIVDSIDQLAGQTIATAVQATPA